MTQLTLETTAAAPLTTVAVAHGDGIGPEIMDATLQIGRAHV